MSKTTPRGAILREAFQDLVRDPQRRRNDDEIVVEACCTPVVETPRSGRRARRVGHADRVALRTEEVGEPATHPAAAADHEGGSATAAPGRGDLGLLLRRQGAPYQEPQQRFRESRRHTEFCRTLSRTQQDLALPLEIACRQAVLALHARDVGADALTLGHEFQ
jgi:hypothetical protein